MIKKTKASRDLLVLSILTLVTILTWIGMDVYRSLTKSKIPDVLEKQLLPLDPTIETNIFDVLEGRLEDIPYSPPSVIEESSIEESVLSSPSAEISE